MHYYLLNLSFYLRVSHLLVFDVSASLSKKVTKKVVKSSLENTTKPLHYNTAVLQFYKLKKKFWFPLYKE
jgi:hypothetical protein